MIIVDYISNAAIPVIILMIVVFGYINNVSVFDSFVDGAKDGLEISIKILPTLIGIMLAIEVFKASGAMEMFILLLSPITKFLGIPSEVLPLTILRPISGSASLALLSQELKQYGPDSFIGRLISTIMGSTETIFYTLAIYLGSINIKKSRYATFVALLSQFVGLIAAIWICHIIFWLVFLWRLLDNV